MCLWVSATCPARRAAVQAGPQRRWPRPAPGPRPMQPTRNSRRGHSSWQKEESESALSHGESSSRQTKGFTLFCYSEFRFPRDHQNVSGNVPEPLSSSKAPSWHRVFGEEATFTLGCPMSLVGRRERRGRSVKPCVGRTPAALQHLPHKDWRCGHPLDWRSEARLHRQGPDGRFQLLRSRCFPALCVLWRTGM